MEHQEDNRRHTMAIDPKLYGTKKLHVLDGIESNLRKSELNEPKETSTSNSVGEEDPVAALQINVEQLDLIDVEDLSEFE